MSPDGFPPHDADNAYSVGRPIVRSVEPSVPDFEPPKHDVDRPELMGEPVEQTRPLGEFYSSVSMFPLRSRAIWRWLLLSLGLAPALALVGNIVDRTGSLFAAGIAVVPLAACFAWSVSYGSALFFCIVETTAAGGNTIEEWPGEDWQEWTDRVIQLCYTLCIAFATSVALMNSVRYGLIRFVPARDWSILAPTWVVFWAGVAVLVYFLFPVILISTMQSHLRWMPLTIPVVRSLVSKKTSWLWLVHWLAGLPMIAVVAGEIYFARPGWYGYTGAGLGAILAGGWMTYARLLGRLGYEISERLPGQPSHAEEKPGNQPEEEADEEAAGHSHSAGSSSPAGDPNKA